MKEKVGKLDILFSIFFFSELVIISLFSNSLDVILGARIIYILSLKASSLEKIIFSNPLFSLCADMDKVRSGFQRVFKLRLD